MEIGIFVLIAVVVLVFGYFSYIANQQRLAEMTELAARLGWRYDDDHDYDFESRHDQFSEFCRGDSRYAYNKLTGSVLVDGVAWPMEIGDYHYQTTSNHGEDKTTHTHTFSFAILKLPYRQLPELLIRREMMFDGLKNLFGFDDIDFESAEFSRRFCVKSPDRRFTYAVIHPQMIEFLLEYEPPSIDIRGGECLLGGDGNNWTPEEFRATVDWAQHFFELWPAHVKEQLKQQV